MDDIFPHRDDPDEMLFRVVFILGGAAIISLVVYALVRLWEWLEHIKDR